jgi:glutamine amidotransferase
LERIGKEAIVTDDHEQIRAADKVIFPGVGEANSAMRYLKERQLDSVIKDLKQPVLGICLGMQLMCDYSEENDTTCLGIFPEKVKLFSPKDATLKVPQIGWNNIYNLQSKLFSNVPGNTYCYFVHGYYAALGSHTIATADYVQPYSAGLHRDNFYGVQFHPEKSAQAGEKIIKNFLEL